MSDNNQPDQTTKCLESLASKSAGDAKLAEFKKTTKEKLDALLKGVADEEDNYRKDFADMKKQWSDQAKKIKDKHRHLQKCYDVDCFKEIICDNVVKPLRTKRRKLLNGLGNPTYCLELAKELHDTTKSEMENWAGITQWIKDRLKEIDDLFDEICEEECKDPCFVIYLFYFELRPLHVDLDPDRDEDCSGKWAECKDWDACLCGPEEAAEGPCERDCDKCEVTRVCTPFLIEPDLYDCRLAAAWEAWDAAGQCMVNAQSRVDEIEKCREDYQEANKPESRRKEARDAIRRYKSKCCVQDDPPPKDDCPPDQDTRQTTM